MNLLLSLQALSGLIAAATALSVRGASHDIPSRAHVARATPSATAAALTPQETYNGGYADATDVLLRIGNGGAGQSGLVGALADAFIQSCVQDNTRQPFVVAWILGDTTQTLNNIAATQVDIGLTYNAAAEQQAVDSGIAVKKELIFKDHFYLVGPPSNPANLTQQDKVADVFNKIVVGGNADVATPPKDRNATRFLSRFDKSATNIKESQLFITIGQVPWAYTYSTWYHQYPRFPLQALQAAALLSEYTLTDRGTWLSSPPSVTDELVVYKAAQDDAPANDDSAILLNPCTAVLSAEPVDKELAGIFMDWVLDANGGQKVIREFKKNGEQLYTPVN